ncbi:MAG: hypothetical protein JRH11_21785 [Deltaproteobacteria bacterium]|nr:hypothetical protein [Deltaproteobacteria bacterium]
MKITRANVSTVSGTMPAVSGNARALWTERFGLHLRLMDEDGRVGHGEASPLPDFSPDNLEGARAALGSRPWETLPEIDDAAPLSTQLKHLLREVDPSLPSVRFAIETAVLDLYGQRQARPAWAMLSEDSAAHPVPIAATLTQAEPGDVLVGVRAAQSRGIDTIKLKIGRPDRFQAELDLIRVIHEEFPRLTIRVDANRSFAARDLPRVLELLAEAGVDLCEEPSAFEAVIRLQDVPLSLAFDESLIGPEGDARLSTLGDLGLLSAVVLKPMALGGLLRCQELARRARSVGAVAIMSHTLDGPIALAATAALAVVLPRPRVAAGLDAHSGLGTWPDVTLPMLYQATIIPVDAPGLGLPDGVDWG